MNKYKYLRVWIAGFLILFYLASPSIKVNAANNDKAKLQQQVEEILLSQGSEEDIAQRTIFKMLRNLGPGIKETLIKIAEKNYKAQIRTMEHVLAVGAIFYIGEFRYQEAEELLKKIVNDGEIERGLREEAIYSLMKINFEGNQKIFEKLLDPQETEEHMTRYNVVKRLEGYPSDITRGLLHKALSLEKKDGVILRIDKTLSKIDDNYKNSIKRKEILRAGVSAASHINYKKKYEQRLKELEEVQQ